MTDTFDRTQLDGKDREQLSEIASALGVKAISRMRKADLVEAIVSATSGSNGSSSGTSESRPRKIRSTVSGGDDLASLAAEEDASGLRTEPVDEMTLIRPRRSTSGQRLG
jgi:transcription termination factor Rho